MAEAAKKDDLDKLLSEFEGEKPKPAATPAQTDVGRLVEEFRPVMSFARAAMERESKQAIDKDIEDAVTFLGAADEAKGVSKKLIRGFLTDWYNNEPDLQEAWKGKARSPELFTKQLEKARTAFVAELATMPTSKLRTDVEAAKAAVSGQRTGTDTSQAPSITAEEAQTMSDSEWRKVIAKHSKGR